MYNADNLEVNSRIAGPGYGLVSDLEWNGYADWWNLYFGSHHPSLCQFVFGDGDARQWRHSSSWDSSSAMINPFR